MFESGLFRSRFDTMLQMLRAGSCVQAEQCNLSTYSARCLLIMSTLKSSLYFFALSAFCVQALAQAAPSPAHATAKGSPAAGLQATEPLKMPEKKNLRPDSAAGDRVKRGMDLRLALMPQNPSSNPSAALKPQGGLSNVADVSTPDLSSEYHLNAKERQEIRELLRQQRLKLQAGPQN